MQSVRCLRTAGQLPPTHDSKPAMTTHGSKPVMNLARSSARVTVRDRNSITNAGPSGSLLPSGLHPSDKSTENITNYEVNLENIQSECAMPSFTPTLEEDLLNRPVMWSGDVPNLKQPSMYMCPMCQYTSTKSFNVRVHMRTHTQEKPFPCQHCAYRATTSGNLKSHQRVHNSHQRDQ